MPHVSFPYIISTEKEELLKELNSLRRDKELLVGDIKKLKSRSTIPELNDEYFKKTTATQIETINNGAKSAHKILKTLEGERQKHNIDKYKSEITFLARENEELKRIVENYTNISEEYVKSIVSRAAKLHNYIAVKLNKPPVEAALCGRRQWDVIDAFTKQARAYIRLTERITEKEKIFEYSEKKVSDQIKNLEAYKKPISKALLDLNKEQTGSTKIFEAKSLATLENLSKLAKEQAVKHELDISERRVSVLKSDISDLLSTQSKWSETKERYEDCLFDKLESEVLRSGAVLEGQKENIREYIS